MLLSLAGNIVRTPVNSIRVSSRGSQGVTLMDVRGEDRLIHIVRVADDDVDETTAEAPADAATAATEAPAAEAPVTDVPDEDDAPSEE